MKIAKEALRLSFPVMVGYVFLGIAFGILCQQQGYSMLWAFLISLSVYAGSMQFVLLTFFHAGFSLVEVALVTLTVNARQLFYGLSFLKSFPAMGKKRWYMMFSLTDETYSLLCAIPNKENREGKQLMFCISLFDQLYWIIGSVLGATIGSLLAFDTTGIDFAMTALFTVIFVEQWLSAKSHLPALLGLLCGGICLLLLGPSAFLLPALILTTALLLILKPSIQRKEETL